MRHEGIHPAVRIGHVHLRVGDLDRALGFYRDALGLGVVADGREAGIDAVFLAAGDYHHHVALNAFESAGGGAPPAGHTGLYHLALLYPDRRELGRALERLVHCGYPVEHATDHGATVSVYLSDPDGNGVELYYDRPRADWFGPGGRPVLKAERFNYRRLLPAPEAAARPSP
jgi:catechol 2,3-dioxygenase